MDEAKIRRTRITRSNWPKKGLGMSLATTYSLVELVRSILGHLISTVRKGWAHTSLGKLRFVQISWHQNMVKYRTEKNQFGIF